MITESEKDTVSTDAAKKALLKDQEERKAKCGAELEQVCKKYNCTLDASVLIRANSVQPQISIIAL